MDYSKDDVNRIFKYDKYCLYEVTKGMDNRVCGCSNGDDVNGTGNTARAR